VYEYVLSVGVYTVDGDKAHIYMSDDKILGPGSLCRPSSKEQKNRLSVLSVCRHMYYEAHCLSFSLNTFHFYNDGIERFLEKLTWNQRLAMTRVSLWAMVRRAQGHVIDIYSRHTLHRLTGLSSLKKVSVTLDAWHLTENERVEEAERQMKDLLGADFRPELEVVVYVRRTGARRT